jgi:hypothetical protein
MLVRRATPLALAVLAVLLGGCSGAPPPSGDASGPARTAESGPPSSPAPEPAALPVYYLAATPAGIRLQREFHRVPSTDPASDAVREMLAASTGTDPDYHSHWPAGTQLRSPVGTENGTIVVDLALPQDAQVGAEFAQLTVQQLVFTVQAALQSTDPVRILVDGAPVDQLWGVATAEPVTRGDEYALRSLVQIDGPAHGAVVGPNVEVTGEAAVFEATVGWQVLRSGAVFRSGFTSTAEGQRFAPFAFTVPLAPGEYVIRVLEDDPSDGEGRPVLTDDKAVTVRG